MARFLVVIVPITARMLPAVAIGDALVAQGHEVAWCGPESDLRPLVGPDAVIYSTGKRGYRAFQQIGVAAVRELWDEYLIPLNRFIHDPVEAAVAAYAPDVVLVDQYALAGAAAAYKRGLPWATLCTGVLAVTSPEADSALHDWTLSRLAQATRNAGLPDGDDLDLRWSPDLVIATTSPTLNGPASLPGHYLLVGAALGSRRADPGFDWDWWDRDREHLLVTAGTLSAHLVKDFLARMVAALEPMAGRVQAVLNAAADAVPDPPPHILVAPRVPMLDLMPRLDAVVCQSGQSTVNEALAHGVPLVVAPIRLGELVVAEQVTRAGAGIEVSYSGASTAELAAAVTAVLDEPGYRAQAQHVAKEYAAAGGTDAAAAQLARLASDYPS